MDARALAAGDEGAERGTGEQPGEYEHDECAARGEEDAGHDSQGEAAQQEEPDVAPVGERREGQLGHHAGQERGGGDDAEAPRG